MAENHHTQNKHKLDSTYIASKGKLTHTYIYILTYMYTQTNMWQQRCTIDC